MARRQPSFVASALATWGTQVALAFLSLANVLIVARVLGPAGRGEVAFLTTVAYLSSQLALLGVEQANVNFAVAERHLRPALATNSVLLALLLGAVAIGIVTLLIALFPAVGGPAPTALRWLALGCIPLLILQVYLLLLVRADYAFGVANLASALGPLVNVTVNGALWLVGVLTVSSAVATWVAGQTLCMLLMGLYLLRRSAGFGRPDIALARRSLRFGVKAHLGRTMLLGNYRLDQWILGAVAGSRALGLYSVAVAWAEALFYLPTALAAVQRPDLVRASRSDAGRQAATVLRMALVATLPIVLGLVVAAPILCVTIFGEAFHGSIAQLRVLSLGAFGIVALKLLGNALTAQRKPMLETAAVGVAFGVTVGLDIALVPAHAGMGASVASLVAYSAGGLAVAAIFTRTFGRRAAELVPRWSEVRGLVRWGLDAARRRPAASRADSVAKPYDASPNGR